MKVSGMNKTGLIHAAIGAFLGIFQQQQAEKLAAVPGYDYRKGSRTKQVSDSSRGRVIWNSRDKGTFITPAGRTAIRARKEAYELRGRQLRALSNTQRRKLDLAPQ